MPVAAPATAAQMKKELMADFDRREAGKKFYAADRKDYQQHLASRTAEQLRWCYGQLRYQNCPVARARDMREQDVLVRQPGFMNMRAA